MKVIFLGTGDFSLKVFEGVAASRHEIAAVVCQPDKVNQRNGKIKPSPVSVAAEQAGISVFKFEKISENVEKLRPFNADIMLTAAYGQMLSEEVLNLTPYGVINTHASLLPKYRGASPIQSAIEAGETISGITIMRTVKKMDAGDIIIQRTVDITGMNSEECFAVMAELAAVTVVEALDLIEDGKAVYTPQNEAEASYCKKLKKSDGAIDFNESANRILNKIRAYYGFPGSYFYYAGKLVKILAAEYADQKGAPGEVLVSEPKKGFVIAAGSGALSVTKIQPEGGKAMAVADYLRGHKIPVGTIL